MMIHKYILKSLLLLLFFNIILFSAEVQLTLAEKEYLKNNQPIKLHNETNWPPYNFNVNGIPKGFSIDYMRLLAKKVGMDIKFVSGYSWNEYMQMLQSNEIDSIINISKNKQRSKIFNFTDIFHTAANAIYVQNGNEKINSLKGLEGKTIIMPKGFFAQQLIEKYYPKINQILVKDSLEALRMLSLGKGDATIGKKNVLDYIISTNNISGVKATNYVDDSRLVSLVRMATNKNNPILRDILQKGQKSISDTELLELKRKWFGTSNDFIKENKGPNFLSQEELIYLKKIKTLKVCSLKDIKPIEFIEDNKLKGITVDTLDLIASKLNLKVKYIKLSSIEESKKLMSENKCDIIPTYYKGIELIDVANLSKPIFKYNLAIITKKGEPIVKNIEELTDNSIAINKESTINKMLSSSYPNLKIFNTKSSYESLEAVNSSKAYFALEPLPIALYYMSKYALNDIYISRYTNYTYGANLAINDNSLELINIINKAINNISENEQTNIFNKWTNVSIKEPLDFSLIFQISLFILIILFILFYRQLILHKHNKKLQLANIEIEKKTYELAKQKELFEKLYSKSADAVLIIKNGIIIDGNESCEKIFNFKINDILGNSLDYLCKSKSKEFILNKIKDTNRYGVSNFEWRTKDKEGNDNWLEVVLTSIEIDNNQVIHGVFRNINKRREMEYKLEQLNKNLETEVQKEIEKNKEKTSQLIHQSRLAQMGEMLSMIAHQWRQPLTAISATTNNIILRNMINEKIEIEELNNELNLICEYSQHLSSTINDFKNFFKSDKEKTTDSLENLVEKSLNIIKASVESNNIKFIEKYNCHKEIYSYCNEIQQVILNILKNAEDVLLERNIKEKNIIISTYCDDNYAYLDIIDNAGGIKKNIIDKIFDPYFSTKKAKDGSGLGLYMSKTIINEHCNGFLNVVNVENGAKFTIKLELDKVGK